MTKQDKKCKTEREIAAEMHPYHNLFQKPCTNEKRVNLFVFKEKLSSVPL